MLAVHFLTTAMLFGRGGDAGAAQLLGVKLPVKNSPLFAIFQDLFLHGGDFLPGFGVALFLLTKLIGKKGNDLLPDGVAIFYKFDFIAGYEYLHHFVG